MIDDIQTTGYTIAGLLFAIGLITTNLKIKRDKEDKNKQNKFKKQQKGVGIWIK